VAQPTRTEIFNALYALVSTATPPGGTSSADWKGLLKQPISWDDVPVAQQPSMFIARGPQEASRSSRMPLTKWKYTYQIYVYFRRDGLPDSDAGPAIEAYLDSLEAILGTTPEGGFLTLGDRTYECWIEGTVVFDAGLEDQQCVILVPISILPERI